MSGDRALCCAVEYAAHSTVYGDGACRLLCIVVFGVQVRQLLVMRHGSDGSVVKVAGLQAVDGWRECRRRRAACDM